MIPRATTQSQQSSSGLWSTLGAFDLKTRANADGAADTAAVTWAQKAADSGSQLELTGVPDHLIDSGDLGS